MPRTFTDEVLDDRVAEILLRKTPAERLAIIAELWELATQLVRDMTRTQHPEWTAEQIRQHVAEKMWRDYT
jgi:hypothetical protein